MCSVTLANLSDSGAESAVGWSVSLASTRTDRWTTYHVATPRISRRKVIPTAYPNSPIQAFDG